MEMEMKYFGFAAAIVSLGIISTQASANLLDDGSFDLAATGTQTSNSNWVLSVNFPDNVNPSAQFEQSSFASNDLGSPETGVWFKSYEGTQGDGDAFAHRRRKPCRANPTRTATDHKQVIVEIGHVISLSAQSIGETGMCCARHK